MANEFAFGGFGLRPSQPEPEYNEPQAPQEEAPVEAAPAPVFAPANEPVEDTVSDEAQETEVEEKPASKTKTKRTNKPRKPKAKTEGISEGTVALIRSYITKVDTADDKTKDVIRFILGLKKGNDDALIAALAGGSAASTVSKAINREIELLDYNDIKAGAVLGGEEKADRKYHWNLAAAVDPEAAAALSPDGAYPSSKDVVDEAISVRELQKGVDGYRDVLTSVKEFVS